MNWNIFSLADWGLFGTFFPIFLIALVILGTGIRILVTTKEEDNKTSFLRIIGILVIVVGVIMLIPTTLLVLMSLTIGHGF
ncbi:MAG: hypothetical protein WCK48_00035 [bacterium]